MFRDISDHIVMYIKFMIREDLELCLRLYFEKYLVFNSKYCLLLATSFFAFLASHVMCYRSV